MTESELKCIIDNEMAMSALPKAIRSSLVKEYESMKANREKQERQQRELEERMSEEDRKRRDEMRQAEEDERKDMLGLNIGAWTQHIPRNRRFVIAHTVKKYDSVGNGVYNPEDCYVPMDILRGYTAPYFGP